MRKNQIKIQSNYFDKEPLIYQKQRPFAIPDLKLNRGPSPNESKP
jgi:hypothetical protein